MSSPVGGNVTMVGLRSDTNLFAEKRLMCRRRYGGNGWRSRNRRRKLSRSWARMPSYFERMVVRATWGMMFLSSSSWKSGVGGRSSVSSKKRLTSLWTSASSNRSLSPASANRGCNGLRFDLEGALEYFLHYARSRLGSASAQCEMEVVQEPVKNLDRVRFHLSA